MVTGSGFDLIQTAVMIVEGDNTTSVEVGLRLLFILHLFFGLFAFWSQMSLSPVILFPLLMTVAPPSISHTHGSGVQFEV